MSMREVWRGGLIAMPAAPQANSSCGTVRSSKREKRYFHASNAGRPPIRATPSQKKSSDHHQHRRGDVGAEGWLDHVASLTHGGSPAKPSPAAGMWRTKRLAKARPVIRIDTGYHRR